MGMSGAEKARRYREKRYAEIEAMPKIPCACGCGELIAPFTKMLKPATYKHNHHPKKGLWEKGHEPHNKGIPYPVASRVHKGKKLPPDEIARRTETRRKNADRVYKKGWRHSPEARARMSAGQKKRDLRGKRNPFYGLTHSEESRKIMSEKLRREKHPNWRGGTGNLPYSVGFTRKFKRLIRERDNFTCQRCGITQTEYGRTLQVHHLDHNKDNNDPSNLATACGKCNMWASYHRDEPFMRG